MKSSDEKIISTVTAILKIHYSNQYDGDLVERVQDAHDYMDKHAQDSSAVEAWCDYEDQPVLVVEFLKSLGADDEVMTHALNTLEMAYLSDGIERAKEQYDKLMDRLHS